MKDTIMNQEKLAKLQAQVRIGGKVIKLHNSIITRYMKLSVFLKVLNPLYLGR